MLIVCKFFQKSKKGILFNSFCRIILIPKLNKENKIMDRYPLQTKKKNLKQNFSIPNPTVD